MGATHKMTLGDLNRIGIGGKAVAVIERATRLKRAALHRPHSVGDEPGIEINSVPRVVVEGKAFFKPSV